MDKCIRRTISKDHFNTDKCRFEPIQGDFIRETEVYVAQCCTPMARHFTLNDSPVIAMQRICLSSNIYL